MGDLFLRNGRVWTGVAATPWAEAALVRDGRFVYVGRESEINPPADTEVLDAGGRLVTPGFIDGHAHLMNTGLAMRAVDLKGVASVEEAVRRVAERVASTAAGGWVRGAGWDQHLWPDARFPGRRELDAVAPGHPVVLTHTSAHCVWVNSAALHAADVMAGTASPAGGAIDLDEEGEPAGILRDQASRLIYGAMPSPSREERLAAVRDAVDYANSLGVTGVHAMDVGRGELAALRSLHEAGSLRLRVRPFLSAARLDDWLGDVRTGEGDDLMKIGGVKFFADGALGTLTAWMLEPYEGTEDTGLALEEPAALEERVRSCLAQELAPAIHAIGDRANREALDILERARELAPGLPRRIEHAQVLSREDIARFGALGVTASMQPVHATQDMTKVDRVWGARGRRAYAFASLLAGGAILAFGSDSPVETMDPLAGVHAAVTRRNAEGAPADGWYPEERVSLETAVAAYTAGCARATGEEERAGKIAAGCYADLVVLSHNLFALDDPMRIADGCADVTVVGGDISYRRPDW